MSRLRYIGSKARLADRIIGYFGPSGGRRLVDLFAGTGVVSRNALLRGWYVYANDYLYASAIVTEAQLISADKVRFRKLGGYSAAIEDLNSQPSLEGFIFREYSPSGVSASGDKRMYFTSENAMRIDAIRRRIAFWRTKGTIDEKEEHLLLADLIGAANHVANIAGTYGCFLSSWDPSAKKNLRLYKRRLLRTQYPYHVTCQDAFSITLAPDDVAYVDPPYSKRQYASYYHLLETIALGDEPKVLGVAGLRPWEHKSSPFCYRRKAGKAFEKLVLGLGVTRVIISYSSEGQIPIEELVTRLSMFGSVDCNSLASIGRYRPNAGAAAGRDDVQEFLIDVNLSRKPGIRHYRKLEGINEQLKLL